MTYPELLKYSYNSHLTFCAFLCRLYYSNSKYVVLFERFEIFWRKSLPMFGELSSVKLHVELLEQI